METRLWVSGDIIYRSPEGSCAARIQCQETNHLWLTMQWHSELGHKTGTFMRPSQQDRGMETGAKAGKEHGPADQETEKLKFRHPCALAY